MPFAPPIPAVRASNRLGNVRYEIHGELTCRALEFEAQGRPIVKLNIRNPGLFGFQAPAHLRRALAENLARSEAYCRQQGLPEAREAIATQQQRGATNAIAAQVFIGNDVSELIDLCLRALLNNGDEVLLPSPDYCLDLVAPKGGFNIAARNHLRMTLLPQSEQRRAVFAGIERVRGQQAAQRPLQRHVA